MISMTVAKALIVGVSRKRGRSRAFLSDCKRFRRGRSRKPSYPMTSSCVPLELKVESGIRFPSGLHLGHPLLDAQTVDSGVLNGTDCFHLRIIKGASRTASTAAAHHFRLLDQITAEVRSKHQVSRSRSQPSEII
jgi:hypothetical protein